MRTCKNCSYGHRSFGIHEHGWHCRFAPIVVKWELGGKPEKGFKPTSPLATCEHFRYYDNSSELDRAYRNYKEKEMTNKTWLAGWTMKEFAWFFAQCHICPEDIKEPREDTECPHETVDGLRPCYACWLSWLRRKHRND